MIFRPINAPSSSNVLSKKRVFARSHRNLEDRRARSSSFSIARWKPCERAQVAAMSKQPLIDQLDQAISGILANPDFTPVSADPALTELLGIAAGLRGLPRPD